MVDVYVYFRELGFMYKEMIKMGSKVVVCGGFIMVCVMFNLNLVLDMVEKLSEVYDLI